MISSFQSCRRSLVLGSALFSIVFAVVGGKKAVAVPLDKQSCLALKGEYDGLLKKGVRLDMAKGPQWVKANLDAHKLDNIRSYLALEAQLIFRCPRITLLPPLKEADEAAVRSQKARGLALRLPVPERKTPLKPAVLKTGNSRNTASLEAQTKKRPGRNKKIKNKPSKKKIKKEKSVVGAPSVDYPFWQ